MTLAHQPNGVVVVRAPTGEQVRRLLIVRVRGERNAIRSISRYRTAHPASIGKNLRSARVVCSVAVDVGTTTRSATVLAISGSLQSRSTNTGLVQLAARLAHGSTRVDVFDQLDTLPYFNPELDTLPAPAAVADLRARLGQADGLLIASPEYAHEMPGVLKNALDWLVSSGELFGKRVAVLCAAPAAERGAYAREALERTLGAQGAQVVLSATIAIPRTGVGDPDVERMVRTALAELVASTA